MAGFAVNHPNGVFEYIFDHDSVSEFKEMNGVSVPFTSLEDWYVIYQLIPNKEYKARMIETKSPPLLYCIGRLLELFETLIISL